MIFSKRTFFKRTRILKTMNERSYKEQIEMEIEERNEKFRQIEMYQDELENQAEIYEYRYSETNDPRWGIMLKRTIDRIEELEDYRRYLEEEVYIDDIEFDRTIQRSEYLIEEDSDDSVEIIDVGPMK